MGQVYNNTIYDVVTLLAYNDSGEALYRSQKGKYFKVQEAPSGESGRALSAKVVPLTAHEAAIEYKRLTMHQLDVQEAFPNIDCSKVQHKEE